MKLFFSTVLVAAPGGEVLTYWESGHPDEYDIWELITRDARYRKAAELLEESVEVVIAGYQRKGAVILRKKRRSLPITRSGMRW